MEEKANLEPLLVTKTEAAHLLGVCLRTLDYLIADKSIAVTRIGSRVLVRYASLKAFIRRDHESPSK